MSTTAARQEQIVESYQFTPSLVLFWLKASFDLTTKRVRGHSPNTVLGMIPLGRMELTYPLRNIASVYSDTTFHGKRLLAGIVLTMIGLAVVGNSLLGGGLLLVFGVSNLLNCYAATLVITNNAGGWKGIELSILELRKVQQFVTDINNCLADL